LKELVELDFSQNKFTNLYLKENTYLVFLGCQNNQLTKLDLRNNLKVTTLYSKGNMGLIICILKTQLNHRWYRDINPLNEEDNARTNELQTNCED
jgi:hypothetical protein